MSLNPFARPRLPAGIAPPPGDGEEHGPPTPRMAELETNAGRAEAQAALRQITEITSKGSVRTRDRETPRLPGDTPAELAGPLALMAMRLLESRMHDVDPRIAMEAARCVVAGAPKVRELNTGPAGDAADPEARRAAMVAALGSDEAVALVVELAGTAGSPVRLALERAGWRPPGAD